MMSKEEVVDDFRDLIAKENDKYEENRQQLFRLYKDSSDQEKHQGKTFYSHFKIASLLDNESLLIVCNYYYTSGYSTLV